MGGELSVGEGMPMLGSMDFSWYVPCALPIADWPINDDVIGLRLLHVMSQAMRPAMIAIAATPPTTPPTIGPTSLFLLEDVESSEPFPPPETGAGNVTDGAPAAGLDWEEADVEVMLAPVGAGAPVDSRRCSCATACAAVTLKASPSVTLRYAHAGMEVPPGMVLGKLIKRHQGLETRV